MAELTAAFDRCDLPADAVDSVLRLLADEGVEVVEAPPGQISEDLRTRRSRTRPGGRSPATWSGSTCARSAGCRC